MFKKLLASVGLGPPVVAGSAHVGKKTMCFVSISEEEGSWYFSWHDEKHCYGEVQGPFPSAQLAENAKAEWFKNTKNVMMAQA